MGSNRRGGSSYFEGNSNWTVQIGIWRGPRIGAKSVQIQIRANSCEFEPASLYQLHRVPAATVTTTVAVAYTVNIDVTRRRGWSHGSKATTEIRQDGQGFPRPQAGGESPQVLSSTHHVHINSVSPEW